MKALEEVMGRAPWKSEPWQGAETLPLQREDEASQGGGPTEASGEERSKTKQLSSDVAPDLAKGEVSLRATCQLTRPIPLHFHL